MLIFKRRALYWLPCAAVALASCSTLRPQGGAENEGALLAREVCSTPAKAVEGRVWMKAKSKEASGQFPAIVKANPQGGVTIEVTYLMGARAALIEIRGTDFKVETPKESVSKKAKAWGGIPLEWASALFMNQVPCPDAAASQSLAWSVSGGELLGRTSDGSESWKFKVAERMGRSFVERVLWEKQGQPAFELVREDPDPQDGWARRWEIRSGAGEVKVRWRDRKGV